MIEQAFADVCEVPVRVSRGRYTLIHLHDMHGRPRHNSRGCQPAQHQPRGMATAHTHDKKTAGADGLPCLLGNDGCGPLSDRSGISKHFDVHCASQPNGKRIESIPVTLSSHLRSAARIILLASAAPTKGCGHDPGAPRYWMFDSCHVHTSKNQVLFTP